MARIRIPLLFLLLAACVREPDRRTAGTPAAASPSRVVPGVERRTTPAMEPTTEPAVATVEPAPVEAPPAVVCPRDTPLPGDTGESFGAALNALHDWQEKEGLREIDFASGREFTATRAGRVRRYLQTATGGDRRRAERLAVVMLGIAARTRDPGGSRWDFTTRMFQVSAQARRLAGSRGISYTGWDAREKRVRTVSGAEVYAGESVSGAVLLLMDVAHYQSPRTADRNMTWKTPMIDAGEVLKPEHYDKLELGDVFFYPDIARGHFGMVLFRHRRFLVVLEGYWKGQPTVIHLFPRAAGLPPVCMARALAPWRGFDALGTVQGDTVTWARNVLPADLRVRGRLRVGEHR